VHFAAGFSVMAIKHSLSAVPLSRNRHEMSGNDRNQAPHSRAANQFPAESERMTDFQWLIQ
jgi:hypothetical protein